MNNNSLNRLSLFIALVVFAWFGGTAITAAPDGITSGPDHQQVVFQPDNALQLEMARQGMIWLSLAFIMWVLSLSLLTRSVGLKDWAFKDHKEKPTYSDGFHFGFFCSVMIVFLWTIYSAMLRDPKAFTEEGELWKHPLLYPRDFAPGFLLACLIPSAFAIYNFWSIRNLKSDDGSAAYTMPGMVLGLINFTASLTKLVTFYQGLGSH